MRRLEIEEFLAEEMALTKAQEKWVREQSGAAVKAPWEEESHPPWYERHAGLVALVGVAAAVAGVVVAVAFVLAPHMEKDMRNDLAADIDAKLKNRGIDHLSEDVAGIRGRLDSIQPFVEDLIKDRMHRAARLNQKDFGSELPRIKQVLTAAAKENVTVPIEDIKAIGKNAIEASSGNSKQASLAWQIVLNLVSYHSSFNSMYKPTAPLIPLRNGVGFKYYYVSAKKNDFPKAEITREAGVPSKQAARYDFIGVDQNLDKPFGPAFLILTGGSVILDGFHIRNAVFEGVEIHYVGGPVILENAIFINCTFVIGNNDPGRRLGESMLASSSVNFKNAA
ncbi:MAG: hypothetical protein WCD04_05450 [Terriglobia bacterium]|jgi:hypothetical protein